MTGSYRLDEFLRGSVCLLPSLFAVSPTSADDSCVGREGRVRLKPYRARRRTNVMAGLAAVGTPYLYKPLRSTTSAGQLVFAAGQCIAR